MRPETQLQIAIKCHLEGIGYRVVHVPNGSVLGGDRKRRAMQMNALKRSGLVVGFPDLIVYGLGEMGHIEIKQEGEYATESQLEVEDWLTKWGHLYAVCRSIADVDETLARWGWREKP